MLYDFDTNGMLQAVTMEWTGPKMFAERVQGLSRFYTLPAAQGGRLELDVPLGRLTLLDAPQLNQVFETYAVKK